MRGGVLLALLTLLETPEVLALTVGIGDGGTRFRFQTGDHDVLRRGRFHLAASQVSAEDQCVRALRTSLPRSSWRRRRRVRRRAAGGGAERVLLMVLLLAMRNLTKAHDKGEAACGDGDPEQRSSVDRRHLDD